MRLSLVHLSDIHFKNSGNPVLPLAAHIAQAAYSIEPAPTAIITVTSGDIAFSGQQTEYEVARKFFEEFDRELRRLCSGSEIHHVSVPGNHDCFLPERAMKVRETLIQGLTSSLESGEHDPMLAEELLKAQAEYTNFRRLFGSTPGWDGLAETVVLEVAGKKIQLNLYNTALVSQRNEQQGSLYVPVKLFQSRVELLKDAALSISVFHHSYLWLESNTAVDFRNHIERTSDIALCGHQHYRHDYYKENSTGEKVLYLEAPALQDEHYSKSSGFKVLVFDIEQSRQKSILFRRSRDMYRSADEIGWQTVAINRVIRQDFRLTSRFESYLNDTGTPLYHRTKGLLTLRDIFVYPDLLVRRAAAKSEKGEQIIDLQDFVSKATRVIFQGGGLTGKTTLAKILFGDILRKTSQVPLFLMGRRVNSIEEDQVLNHVWKSFEEEYGREMLDEFKQLPLDERTLIVDDWHRVPLSAEGRRACLAILSKYFGRIFLFVDELFQLHELIDKAADILLDFDYVSVREFGSKLRGKLIDKWVTMGREHLVDSSALANEIEEKERLINSVLGKNTLPRHPAIILFLLQAAQEDKAEAAEAGSFGYLYEVLVTVALSQSTSPRAQLEKKYTFLSRLAYKMFKDNVWNIPLSQVERIAEEYSKSHLVTLDFPGMLKDLESARVLVNIDGNYSFAYGHLFYYFVARFYRDNLDRLPGLRAEIEKMTDELGSDINSSVLIFIVYFARESSGIVKRLVANADKIYANEPPAELDTEIEFLNQLCSHPDIEIPVEIDIEENRRKRRELEDRALQNLDGLEQREKQPLTYSEDLSDVAKFDLAYRHMGILGQVIRNFPGSLPGPDKLIILRATYLLGLRTLRALLRMLDAAGVEFRATLAQAIAEKHGNYSEQQIREVVAFLIVFVSRVCTLHVIMKIASDVGARDLETAYREALELVGHSNATELIHLTLALNYFTEFPLTDIRELHKKFADNPFADTVLADIVVSRMSVMAISRRIRQSIASMFKLAANSTLLVEENIRE